MPSDISRNSDSRPYKGVVMQQGRVILDRDFNAQRDALDRQIEADALNFVGPCGTPDNGFAITAVNTSGPALWTPPAPLTTPATGQAGDFSISPGTMYVGGQRVVFPPSATGQPAIQYSYYDQPDWISPPVPASAAQEFVYLSVVEQEVSAVEDFDLHDVALGGPDTTQRLKLIKRVKRLPLTDGATDCVTAGLDAAGIWLQQGLQFDPLTMRLIPQAALQVSFPASTTNPSPCDPTAPGGYFGADNQLIRVQITDGGVGATPTLLWGYDNASSLYRATLSQNLSNGATTLTLGESPIDSFHVPQQWQVVEVLRAALVIGGEPDQSTPGQSGTLVPCVAESTGIVCTQSAPFQSNPPTITIAQQLPGYSTDTQLFVRIWQSQVPFTFDGTTPAQLTYGNGNTSTAGLQVTVGPANSSIASPVIPIGAYWMLGVRPSTPQQVYPQRLIASAQLPDGPRQWACPLGTIDWTGQSAGSPPSPPAPVFNDCRQFFNNLVSLSQQGPLLGGCFSVTLQPGDLTGNPLALQAAVDQFANASQGVSILLTPGVYQLTQPLRLDARHAGITIAACQGAVTLEAANVDLSVFLDGLAVATSTTNITFSGITFIPPSVDLMTAVAQRTDSNSLQTLAGTLQDPHFFIGIRLLDCNLVTVTRCHFQFTTTSNLGILVRNNVGIFAAGIFANGSCTGLAVRQCTFVHLTQIILRRLPIDIPPISIGIEQLRMTSLTARSAAVGGASVGGAANTSKTSVTTNLQSAIGALRPQAGTVKPEILNKPGVPYYPPVGPVGPVIPVQPVRPTDPNPVDTNPPVVITPPVVPIVPVVPQPVDPILPVAPAAQVCVAAFLIAPSITDASLNSSTGTTGGTQLAQPILDTAEFSDNVMNGMTVGILGLSLCGQIKIENNTIENCSGGIWLFGLNPSAAGSTDILVQATSRQSFLQSTIQMGTAAYTMFQLAMWYPLPSSPTGSALAGLPSQLLVVGNLIDALPSQSGLSGPACIFYMTAPLSSNANTPDANSSILFSSNQVRNLSDPGIADTTGGGATTYFYGSSNIVVSGNLIKNMQPAAANIVWSFAAFPGTNGLLAASGNIFVGATTLASPRPELDPNLVSALVGNLSGLAQWQFLNNVTPLHAVTPPIIPPGANS